MHLLYANTISLVFHYLAQLFYGISSMSQLQSGFATSDQNYTRESQGRESYDFIIVGGGSAGCVVASRLSENPNYTVLLVEAGGNPFPLTSVPAMAMLNLRNPNVDWCDTIQPQKKACHSFKNNAGHFDRGKILGGGSSLNYMLAMRGSPKDYNRWAMESGDDSWTYDNLLPYFRKMETYTGQFFDAKFHGTDGPLSVEKNPFAPLLEEWLEAGKELGFQVKDPNRYQTDSFFPFETTTKKGTRHSTHRAYLYPALSRKNLKVQLYSTVQKINFDSANRAIGIEYEYKGQKYQVTANREIILSSGSVGSPQLLMLSGIGPKSHLESLDIQVKMDLPAVGQNLQDHLMSLIGPFMYDDKKLAVPLRTYNEETLHHYILNGTGPYSGTGVAGGALTQSSKSPGWSDIYLTTSNIWMNKAVANVFERVFNFEEGQIQKYLSTGFDKFNLLICLVTSLPKSKGQIRLKSKDPTARPVIDPNYFDDEDDAQVMLEGFKFTFKIAKSKAMERIGLKLTPTLLPGCEKFGNNSFDNEEYWKCYFRHWTSSMWHYASTNKMGKSRQDSVVDSNLRVFGVKGLRIMDASVMPKVTTTNTNLPTIMIAEKGADMIKKYWENQN